jgi:uncharacterized integral membrane protein
MKFKSILALIIFILVAVIFIQNTEVVEFKIYFWKIQMSRIILLPAILLIGFIIGYIVAKVNRHRIFKEKMQKIKESVPNEQSRKVDEKKV